MENHGNQQLRFKKKTTYHEQGSFLQSIARLNVWNDLHKCIESMLPLGFRRGLLTHESYYEKNQFSFN